MKLAINAELELAFVVSRVNAKLDDAVSLSLAVAEDAADLDVEKKNGEYVSLYVSNDLYRDGFCPGAAGMLTGIISQGKEKTGPEGGHFYNLEVTGEVTMAKRGRLPLSKVNWDSVAG